MTAMRRLTFKALVKLDRTKLVPTIFIDLLAVFADTIFRVR